MRPLNTYAIKIEELGLTVNNNIDEVIEWADAINVLRIQRERMNNALIPSVGNTEDYLA